jgi:hypothetical protein
MVPRSPLFWQRASPRLAGLLGPCMWNKAVGSLASTIYQRKKGALTTTATTEMYVTNKHVSSSGEMAVWAKQNTGSLCNEMVLIGDGGLLLDNLVRQLEAPVSNR